MNTTERRATLSLAAIFSFRMLGMFMILPVFALYADGLAHTSPTQVGLALGVYGLTQALLQIPFGLMSDRFGRKSMITIGLLLFAIGSVVAAMATSINGVIIGRAIQGAGAVGSVIIALVADLTREEERTKAMALIGMSIGASFALAMVLGPLLHAWIDVPGIFWVTSGLALVGLFILHVLVPTPTTSTVHLEAETVPQQLLTILKNKELLRLDFGIFTLHAILTAMFTALPITLETYVHLKEAHQWMLYLPVLFAAIFVMVPFVIIAEKKQKMKPIYLGAIAALGLSQFCLWQFHTHLYIIAIILTLFFGAFTLLEATLPSIVSKLAPVGQKGTAIGVYSSCQFLGSFVGGYVGGKLFDLHEPLTVFMGCAGFALIWLIVALFMKKPQFLSTRLVHVGATTRESAEQLCQQLLSVNGVKEALVIGNTGTAYLKVDKRVLNDAELEAFSKPQS